MEIKTEETAIWKASAVNKNAELYEGCTVFVGFVTK